MLRHESGFHSSAPPRQLTSINTPLTVMLTKTNSNSTFTENLDAIHRKPQRDTILGVS